MLSLRWPLMLQWASREMIHLGLLLRTRKKNKKYRSLSEKSCTVNVWSLKGWILDKCFLYNLKFFFFMYPPKQIPVNYERCQLISTQPARYFFPRKRLWFESPHPQWARRVSIYFFLKNTTEIGELWEVLLAQAAKHFLLSREVVSSSLSIHSGWGHFQSSFS